MKGGNKMREYLLGYKEILSSLKSSYEGISEEESKIRLKENGLNKLEEGKKTPLIVKFLKELTNPMIIILIVAAIVSGITAAYANESFADVFIIFAVVVINGILGVYQENKSEKAIEALQDMTASTCKVIRNNKQVIIKSEELVPGDLILLEAGDAVPADGRIIESVSLKIEEAALTGESVAVTKHNDILSLSSGEKDIPLGDRKNMVYMGSSVVYGRGRVVVTATGMNTEMGKIARVLSNTKESQTPLQVKLNQLSKILSFLVIGICIFIFLFTLGKSYPNLSGKVFIDTFMVAVSLAVAAIPEGLATVVTIVLAIGVTNMSKKSAVIRKLTAVETLGCAQIICSDKTGTLTQNKMTVVKYYGNDEKLLAKSMALCSDATLDEDSKKAVGEPTECALVNYAYNLGLNKNDLIKTEVRAEELPFDSNRKMMTTIHKHKDNYIQYTKGAPDVVLKHCNKILINDKVEDLSEEIRNEIIKENKNMADKALRVLCSAIRYYEEVPKEISSEALENNLIFLGLTGMIDPVREEVVDAIKECNSAGIRPIMITGDHKDTAVAIAMELGIIKDSSEAITGAMLSEMNDEEFEKNIEKYSVYARVQPEHKVRIVNTWKKKGKISAMTGDGVNDAPAIKSADIGVGMGITGTDVTKNVSDMVLADDNFATIVHAVKEGRRIYDNIRKSIQFLLSSNLSEVVAIFFATLVGFVILKPVHLLWINLITDCFPALALGTEKEEEDIMKRSPRNSRESIFAGGVSKDVIWQGFMIAIITIVAYVAGHYMESGIWEFVNSADGMTMAFLTMSMAEIFHSFNLRSRRHSIFTIKGQNKFLWGAMIVSLLLTLAVIYIPFLSNAFGLETISLMEYGVSLLISFTVIPIVEVVKFFQRRYEVK
ncbi:MULTISPECIES: calcium-translocating P-type ATPase, PMCA-type [Terrisporobacter]|uniref:P-type Ca(2+) transporter n=1 Tax=Terrisporobacter muris TaxID=2963284 RepID=A0A9X2MCJ7_9FIRM|nr:calcium-translocating P-type ATPase, PMCA-type [Terrisporobacter othiniensis]MCR1823345.1 calcium-translocating P-type ATPase, PMCA-type [Terrisporobacter muris]MDU6982955.1 calcium-translocating P-type ATPase, PMCA-type [Terrisporobacter othiniensis]MDY3373480.1 calcium-translocating P-type ATPase, PMCA-type [Terrisporobacter othiniensis]